jgi:hypothetical protein
MWNLTGDDIQRAKDELVGRRAAIKARYDSEMKQLEADLASLETFERAAVNFVSNFKGEEAPPEGVAEPTPAAATVAADVASEERGSASGEAPAEENAEAEKAAAAKSSSRWRMRLSPTEGSP